MELNQAIHNFTVTNRTAVDELEATLWQMEHRKSGARLVWLEREEENKTFSIAFQTQPWNDTGIFHILEHSVLCGSDRYPVKEPFVELLKSSLNTFLNAMTAPDMTIYPVSSRNDQDFINLTRVYMDAVLHPLIHSKPEIFGQEGWHYELDEKGEPSYKGVVFNEMKGAMSSPDEILDSEIQRRLFPDTCYHWNSGGDPAHIPELTYEQFTATHKRLYHPSNAYIVLDGHMDIETILGILDGEYLSAYERIPAPAPIALQSPVDAGTSEVVYELSAQEDLEGRARLADGFVYGTYEDREKITAVLVLADVLCGDNHAPLKKRLLDAGLAKDVNLSSYYGAIQPRLTLEAKDVREDKLEDVSSALYDELARLVREGLDHKRICATLDNMEFQARERDYGRMPQGLMFCFQVLESWMYGGDPAARLSVGSLYDGLRAKCEEGWFEALLERVLLKNNHKCRVIMRPSHTLGQEKQEAETARLKAAQAAWTPEETERVRTLQANIETWQNTPDTPEALATIPMLKLDQVPAETERLPQEEGEIAGLPVLLHRLPTGGISYLNLYFDIDDLPAEELTETAFMCELLSSLDTEGHPLEALQREIRSRFGSLGFTVQPYGRRGEPEQCRTFLCVTCSALDGKLPGAVELLAEILTGTRWNDAEKVNALLCQKRAALADQAAQAGHVFSMNRVLACDAADGVVAEHTGGIVYLRWLKALEDGFQERFPQLAETLAALAGRIFVRKRLTVSVTGSGTAEETLGHLVRALPEGSFARPDKPLVKPWGRRKEGIVVPADVSFAAMGGVSRAEVPGAAKVAGRVVSLGYLWNAVRVQGGAYGVGMGVRDNGTVGFYSFRDPTAARTLDCYRASGDFLREAKDMDLTGMILGALAESDPLLTPRMKGKTADSLYWRGTSYENLCQDRREMLSAGPEDLTALAEELDRLAEDASVCVLGSRKQLDACEGLDEVTVL